jgi:hypothetical protein
MTELRELHESYRLLTRFLDVCRHGPARVLATARFLDGLPDDLAGVAFFVDDLLPHLTGISDRATFRFIDPEIRESVRTALQTLIDRGRVDPPQEERLRQWVEELGREPSPLPELDPHEQEAQVTVLIPVVQEIPSFPHSPSPPIFLASIMPMSIVPRRQIAGERADRWVQHTARVATSELGRMEDISATAMAAARSQAGAPDAIGFDILTNYPGVTVAGDSAGLGLAAGFAGALAGLAAPGAGCRPASRLAWTGRMFPTGVVGSVRTGSLRAKVRAAYYEGLEGIVVPREMEAAARDAVPSGGRTFEVIGVDRLADTFADRRLFTPWRLPRNLLARRPVRRRRAALLAGAGIVAALAVTAVVPGLREWLPWGLGRSGPVDVVKIDVGPDGTILVHKTSGGAPLALHVPKPYPAVPKNTLAFSPDSSRQSPWVIAWTQSPPDSTPPAILGWNLRGKPLFTIPATADTPYPDDPLNADKIIFDIFPLEFPSPAHTYLAVFEGCHGSTGITRLFDPVERPTGRLRQVFRYYHDGHLRELMVTQGPEPGSRLAWMFGSVSSKAIGAPTGQKEADIDCILCVPFHPGAEYVFPPWSGLDAAFTAGHPEGLLRGEELFYFVVRLFRDTSGTIDWVDAPHLMLDVVRVGPAGGGFRADLLTRNDLQLTLDFAPGQKIVAEWTPKGRFEQILADRRKRGDPEAVNFMADSLVSLAYASSAYTIEGNFRDIRAAMPKPLP